MRQRNCVPGGVSSPLPWNLTFDGDDYVLTARDGDLVYRGPDGDHVTELYQAVQQNPVDLRNVSDAELLTEVARRLRRS